MQFAPLGDSAVMITLGDTIDERTHRLVRAASTRIRGDPPPGFVDLVPAFVSIVVHYDPSAAARRGDATPHECVVSFLRERLASLDVEELGAPRVVEIPAIAWKPILHGIILRTRPRKSAEAYNQVWTNEGSPLRVISCVAPGWRTYSTGLPSTLRLR